MPARFRVLAKSNRYEIPLLRFPATAELDTSKLIGLSCFPSCRRRAKRRGVRYAPASRGRESLRQVPQVTLVSGPEFNG